MLLKIKNKLFAALLLGALAALSFPTPSTAADCQAFPKLTFWGDLSHDSVQNYVETKFDGDWDTYIERLQYIKKGLQEINSQGKGALIKMKGRKVVLKGEKLLNYLRLSNTRINIVRCLADKMDAAGLQDFATAAGGNDPVETAAAPEEDYRTLMILPKKLIIKLRKIAVHRGLIENQLVTVNDIISRILRTEFARSGE